jgi:hypothetical protein
MRSRTAVTLNYSRQRGMRKPNVVQCCLRLVAVMLDQVIERFRHIRVIPVVIGRVTTEAAITCIVAIAVA